MKTMIFLVISVIIFIGFAVWTQNILVSSAADLGQHLDRLESAVKNDNWESAGNRLEASPGYGTKTGTSGRYS